MKITKSKLKQIIKEELSELKAPKMTPIDDMLARIEAQYSTRIDHHTEQLELSLKILKKYFKDLLPGEQMQIWNWVRDARGDGEDEEQMYSAPPKPEAPEEPVVPLDDPLKDLPK